MVNRAGCAALYYGGFYHGLCVDMMGKCLEVYTFPVAGTLEQRGSTRIMRTNTPPCEAVKPRIRRQLSAGPQGTRHWAISSVEPTAKEKREGEG